MARMRRMWRLCGSMPRRVAFLELANPFQKRYPSGCRVHSREPEPALFVDVGLLFYAVDDWDEFFPADDDEPFPDNWTIISAGSARLGSTRVHRGKCMALRVSTCSDRRCPDHCHCIAWEGDGLVVLICEPPTRICSRTRLEPSATGGWGMTTQ